MAGNESRRTNPDTHKMSTEEVKRTGVDGSRRPPGNNPGEHPLQRRELPSITTMAVTGFVFTAAIAYMVLYARRKAEATALRVAKAAIDAAIRKW